MNTALEEARLAPTEVLLLQSTLRGEGWIKSSVRVTTATPHLVVHFARIKQQQLLPCSTSERFPAWSVMALARHLVTPLSWVLCRQPCNTAQLKKVITTETVKETVSSTEPTATWRSFKFDQAPRNSWRMFLCSQMRGDQYEQNHATPNCSSEGQCWTRASLSHMPSARLADVAVHVCVDLVVQAVSADPIRARSSMGADVCRRERDNKHQYGRSPNSFTASGE
eukprot:2869422-Amphidinium_carterae.1